ncbi:OVARIAN TUMOR DOMAIN-containing deubiquitinating enzyme 4 [Typha latifolia]|uniref:OVARIAN TUMOR DOMAIN-containing deubiquitinating enzyme 4 n=1 Tax=Typha latifolia TaxID=4733 RepID=UPI003C2C566D
MPTIYPLLSSFSSIRFHSSQFGGRYACSMTRSKPFHSSSVGYQASGCSPVTMAPVVSLVGRQLRAGLSVKHRSMSLRLSMPTYGKLSRIGWNWRRIPWKVGGTSAGVWLSFSTSGTVYAESSMRKGNENAESNTSSVSLAHGKKVYTKYSITGIPGDGRCLFRSVAHGACIRSGKPLPNEDLQRELADDLRARVADEFVKRRAETEWFVEGDFDTYVSQIRKPHVWGGEPELFMASHVLEMPITVYMHDEDAGGLIAIAEYGQEYGKENPIQVLYHGFGHYDALQIPGTKGSKSRL